MTILTIVGMFLGILTGQWLAYVVSDLSRSGRSVTFSPQSRCIPNPMVGSSPRRIPVREE